MTYSELLDEIRKVPLEELRIDSPEWFEFVIFKDSLGRIQPSLENFFGPPRKRPEAEPSREIQKMTAPFGGVWAGQTLYWREQGDAFHCGLFWPWGDGTRVTVKLIEGRSSPPAS